MYGDNEWVYEDDHDFQEAEARNFGEEEENTWEDEPDVGELQEWDDYYGGDNGDHGMYRDEDMGDWGYGGEY